MPDQKPSLGRVVHYIDNEGKHYTATIAYVWSDTCVNLGCLDHNGNPFSKQSVSYDANATATYSWHWPERVS